MYNIYKLIQNKSYNRSFPKFDQQNFLRYKWMLPKKSSVAG